MTEPKRYNVIREAEELFLAYDEPSLETGVVGLLYSAVELLKSSYEDGYKRGLKESGSDLA